MLRREVDRFDSRCMPESFHEEAWDKETPVGRLQCGYDGLAQSSEATDSLLVRRNDTKSTYYTSFYFSYWCDDGFHNVARRDDAG